MRAKNLDERLTQRGSGAAAGKRHTAKPPGKRLKTNPEGSEIDDSGYVKPMNGCLSYK
jgi:hypothetical protein